MTTLVRLSHSPMSAQCPLCPRKLTSVDASSMSASCQKRTYTPQQTAPLFDHLVGNGEQRWGDGNAEHPGRVVVDDKLELGCLHDRQVRRLGTLEDASGIDAD